MKKLIAGFATMAVLLVGLLSFNVVAMYDAVQEAEASNVQTIEPYTYVISEVNGDEINGLAVTNKSDSNGGIVLSEAIDGVKLNVGDIIEVTYGEAFDDIVEVKIVE